MLKKLPSELFRHVYTPAADGESSTSSHRAREPSYFFTELDLSCQKPGEAETDLPQVGPVPLAINLSARIDCKPAVFPLNLSRGGGRNSRNNHKLAVYACFVLEVGLHRKFAALLHRQLAAISYHSSHMSSFPQLQQNTSRN